MKSIKGLLLSGVIAGTVLASGSVALARDHDRWDHREDPRWYSRDYHRGDNGSRGSYNDARQALIQARQKYEYDQRRHAGHKTLDADRTEISRIEQSMGGWRR